MSLSRKFLQFDSHIARDIENWSDTIDFSQDFNFILIKLDCNVEWSNTNEMNQCYRLWHSFLQVWNNETGQLLLLASKSVRSTHDFGKAIASPMVQGHRLLNGILSTEVASFLLPGLPGGGGPKIPESLLSTAGALPNFLLRLLLCA